jgi:tRNA pseudouridine38-40 synthase
MRVLKLTIAYDGTRFVGWQRQAEGESIQGLIEEALARFEGAAVTLHGAGRTDAGVHALGQVASARVTFTHDVGKLTRALNAQLPDDVRVLSAEDAPPDFHARFSARAKTYCYQLRAGGVASPFDRAYVWNLPEALDVPAMQEAAAHLVGTHDFAAFRSTGTDVATTVRTITVSHLRTLAPSHPRTLAPSHLRTLAPSHPRTFAPSHPLLLYKATGTGFLRHMVRAIVGTLVEIGRGWRSPDDMAALLAGGTRAEAGATAPPHGLFLAGVDYD